jgi:hypothetical protein
VSLHALPPLGGYAPRNVRVSQGAVDSNGRANDATRRLARLSTEAPRVPWDKFIAQELRWRSGEHFALIGPTGQGKTTMLHNLLPLHPYVVIFATKPKDESMTALSRSGYQVFRKWPQGLSPYDVPRRIVWPDARKMDSEVDMKAVFHDAFARIYREGGWTVALDEMRYITENLGLERDVKTYLMQARSLGISMLNATQRPAFVPLEVYDQSTHLMFWRDNDEQNLRRLSGISYRSADLIRELVSDLERFQVLYINTRDGRMIRTRCPQIRQV